MCGCVKKDKSTTNHSTTNEYNRHYKAKNRKYDDLGAPADAVHGSTSTEVVRFSASPSEPPPVDERCKDDAKVEEVVMLSSLLMKIIMQSFPQKII